MATLLPIAFPPIVKEATKPVINNVVISIFIDNLLETINAIDEDNAPLIIPQISPITSLQKLDNFSEFFINLTPTLAPLTFFDDIELKVFKSATVTLIPIISNITPSEITINKITMLIIIPTLDIITSDNKELSQIEIWRQRIQKLAGVGETTAYVSMHEKDDAGNWKQIITTPGYIGKHGLGKTKEGDGMTPIGAFHFTDAFGIAVNPGVKEFKYKRVGDSDYWSGDQNYKYNTMVNINDYPKLNMDDSEHIVDYTYQYQYCLNISYNEEGEAGKGSAIFLHCLGPYKPYTGGCVAIPKDQMIKVMKNVEKDCVVVIDYLQNLSPETYEDWGL